MADYLNKDILIPNGITTNFGGRLYPWMVVKAGGGSSEFSEVRMRGPIFDKNGVEILGGGGSGGGDKVGIWRPNGVQTARVYTGVDSSGLQAFLNGITDLTTLYIDNSLANPILNSVITLNGIIELVGYDTFSTNVALYPTVEVRDGGSFVNPREVSSIALLSYGANTEPALLISAIAPNNMTCIIRNTTILAMDALSTVPLIRTVVPSGLLLSLYFDSVFFRGRANNGSSIEITGASATILKLTNSTLFGDQLGNASFFAPSTSGTLIQVDSSSRVATVPQTGNVGNITYTAISNTVFTRGDDNTLGLTGNQIVKQSNIKYPTTLGITLQDFVDTFKLLNAYTYYYMFGNINQLVFNDPNPNALEITVNTQAAPFFRRYCDVAQVARWNGVDLQYICEGNLDISIKASFTLRVLDNSGGADIALTFIVDGALQPSAGSIFNFELPPAGQSFTLACTFTQVAWPSGQIGRFRITRTSSGNTCTVLVESATIEARQLPPLTSF